MGFQHDLVNYVLVFIQFNAKCSRESDGVLMYETNCLTYWRSIKIISKISRLVHMCYNDK